MPGESADRNQGPRPPQVLSHVAQLDFLARPGNAMLSGLPGGGESYLSMPLASEPTSPITRVAFHSHRVSGPARLSVPARTPRGVNR